MKKLLLVLLASIFSLAAHAQVKLFVSGSSALSRGKFSGLNYVIDRYNETRQGQNGAATLTHQMQPLKTYLGFGWRVGLGFYFDHLGIYTGLSRTGRKAFTYAEGVDANSQTVRRDLRFTANSVGLEAGLLLGHPDLDGFTLLVGGSVDFINYRAYTRTGNTGYTNVMKDLSLGVSGFFEPSFLLTDRLAIGMRLGYQLTALRQDFSDVSFAINPSTWQNDDSDRTSSFCHNLSAQLMLTFIAGGD